MNRILVVEDDAAILRGLKDNLEAEGHQVITATDGAAGYRLIQTEAPDLVILDLMLPGLSGYEVCRKVREDNHALPIMMLTARGEEADRVLGLDLGADDYMAKPFSIRELLARVRALLRRAAPPVVENQELRFGEVVVDFRAFQATVRGQPVAMTRKEFGVLGLLVARGGAAVTRAELLTEVWGYSADTTTRTVDNHLASLRAKLEVEPASPQHLITVHGVGYKLVT